jgi:hypothetical protein
VKQHNIFRLVSAITATTLVLLGAGSGAAGAAPTHKTPSLPEIFNGFVVGAFSGAKMGTTQEIFHALTADDPFYKEPKLTGSEKPGQLLKSKKVDVMYSGVKPANLNAYKIMYVTTGLDAKTPEISTGIVMVPQGRRGVDRKVVSYQEANDSVGGNCHPSGQWTGQNPMDGASWSALGPLAIMFDKGYTVTISDVGNTGDNSPHGVFAGTYAGHAQLDAVRAAQQLPKEAPRKDAEVVLFGIAGGGVGAARAAEDQDVYAPELKVKAAVLEGMVIDQRNFMRIANGSVGSGFAFANLLGLEPKYPDMNIDAHLNPTGKKIADWYRTQCQTPAYFTMPFVPLQTLFKGNKNPADIPSFQRAYRDNVLGKRAPKPKVLITSCAKDDSVMSIVPAKDARNLAAKYRRGGTRVTYAPTNCSWVEMITNLYHWSTDLIGAQTLAWVDAQFTR